MQQRNVIIVAVLLALLLAGLLWYGLSREADVTTFNTATSTPTNTEVPGENITGVSAPDGQAPVPQNSPAIVAGTDIQPTAGSGTSENILIATIVITLISGAYFVRALRNAPAHRVNN